MGRGRTIREWTLEGASTRVHSFAMSPAAGAMGPTPSAATPVAADTAAAGAAGLERVYAEWADYVWRMLQRLGVRRADLEDVCHDVFLVAHRRFAEFDG